MSKTSRPDAAAAFNGDKQGELYSPEYALRIDTKDKGKQQNAEEEEEDKGQGELYSPQSAIHISAPQQDSDKHLGKADYEESTNRNDEDTMRKSSSKL